MKTSILLLIVGLGFSGNAWAYFGPCDDQGVHYEECLTDSPDGVAPSQADTNTLQPLKPIELHPSTPDAEKIDTTKISGSQNQQAVKGTGCGTNQFGGASCDTTEAINMGVNMANKLVQTIGTAAVQNKGTDVQNQLNSKGSSATNADYLNGQAKAADSARKSNNDAGVVQTVNAGLQAWRTLAHQRSVAKIAEQASKQSAACETQYQDQNSVLNCKNDIKKTSAAEIAAQKNEALKTGVAAALTVEQAAASYENANMAKKTAESLREQAKLSEGAAVGQFQMNQQTNPGQDQGIDAGTPVVDTGAVTSTDPAGTNLDGGIKDFNPNLTQDGALGPQAGAFKEAAANAAGGGQGPGLGGAGGTSASRGDGSDGQPAGSASKPQTGGQYASGDAGSPKFSRGSGAGAGVGMDTSFADLLKKMLPGNNEEKKDDQQASLALDQDRSPASDQATVMGRNKNIFFEISKRYQKKSHEGAVIFQ